MIRLPNAAVAADPDEDGRDDSRETKYEVNRNNRPDLMITLWSPIVGLCVFYSPSQEKTNEGLMMIYLQCPESIYRLC